MSEITPLFLILFLNIAKVKCAKTRRKSIVKKCRRFGTQKKISTQSVDVPAPQKKGIDTECQHFGTQQKSIDTECRCFGAQQIVSKQSVVGRHPPEIVSKFRWKTTSPSPWAPTVLTQNPLSPPGDPLEASWASPGPSLGSLWGTPGFSLGPPRVFPAPTPCTPWAPPWGVPGPSGAPWAPLGSPWISWGLPGVLIDPSRPPWDPPLSPSWAFPGPALGKALSPWALPGSLGLPGSSLVLPSRRRIGGFP